MMPRFTSWRISHLNYATGVKMKSINAKKRLSWIVWPTNAVKRLNKV